MPFCQLNPRNPWLRVVTPLSCLSLPVLQWYVDVVLALLERAGDFCGEDIWHRVVQLITNNEQSQAYAAGRVVEVLRRGASHEALMCMAGYVLGEYGKLVQVRQHCTVLCLLVCQPPNLGVLAGSWLCPAMMHGRECIAFSLLVYFVTAGLLLVLLQASVPSMEQFKLLHERFPTLSIPTKGLLLSAYLKMLLHDASNAALQAEVVAVFSRYSCQLDPELQQRSTEYLVGARLG
jgi:AP-2 complex subunit alpha